MRFPALSVVILSCSFGVPLSAAEKSIVPPLKLTLIINGESFSIEDGQEQNIAGEFTNPTIVVRATRQFSKDGISFEYPASFLYQFDNKIESRRRWIFFGKISRIIYDVASAELTPETYISSAVEKLTKIGVKVVANQAVSRKFGEITLEGKRLIVDFGPKRVVQDTFAIPGPDNEWRLLTLQDVAPERIATSEEPKEVLNLITKSLRWKNTSAD